MRADHLNEMEWSTREALVATMRGVHDSGLGVIALCIGIVVCRISGSSCRRAEPRPAAPERPVLRAAGRAVGRHAGALGQLIGRILAAVFA